MDRILHDRGHDRHDDARGDDGGLFHAVGVMCIRWVRMDQYLQNI